MLYRVGLRRTNLLKMSLVIAAAMLAICLLALVETTNTADATSLPQNGKIAFGRVHSGEASIYTVEPHGSNLKQLTDGELPTWSPDGTEIVFYGPSGAKLSVVSAEGPNVGTVHTIKGVFAWDSTWFPDGTKVAFSESTQPGSNIDIFMMDLDGSNKTNLTKTPQLREYFPDFSPNGSHICFYRESDSSVKSVSGIYVMDADRSDPTLLFETESFCDWSPDGKKVAFTTFDQDPGSYLHPEVYVINADGSGRTALTSNAALDDYPAWSPDGTKIVFSSDRDGDLDTYTMDADGSDVAQVTNLPGEERSPDWQPLPGTTVQDERYPDWQPLPGTTGVHQPDTGGPSLLLASSILLFSGGVLLYAGVKRRM